LTVKAVLYYDELFTNYFFLKGFLILELKGSLSNFSLPDIVQLIGTTKRSGVLLVIVGPEKASIYFDEGMIVHAVYRSLGGQEAFNRIFREKEGSFQFLAGVETPEKSLALDWMGALMEAARLHDEGGRDDDFEDLDFEAALSGPAEETRKDETRKAPAWDPGPVKAKMAEILEESFGRKAKKIVKELQKNPGNRLNLLEFCEKAEKYIYVFIDNRRSEEIGNRLRTVIEESLQ